uniref:Uncharacterized protein n=1 Tax=Meloidogyne enterolobii TaxID=390850 RepID=A0A6V7UDJ5_MELEN|nr:unnamed protein product [Meloidogyne enterolobii]
MKLFIFFIIILFNFELNYSVQLLNNILQNFTEKIEESQIYTLQVLVKISDGGDIWMIQDFEGPNGFSGRKNETVNIEDVLRAVHGIEVECVFLIKKIN